MAKNQRQKRETPKKLKQLRHEVINKKEILDVGCDSGNEEVTIKLKEFKTTDDLEKVVLEKFLQVWIAEFKVDRVDCNGIIETYYTMKERGLQAFDWLYNAYRYTKRKKDQGSLDEDGNINGYFITVLRNWMINGRGNSGTWQDRIVVESFKGLFTEHLTQEQLHKIYELVGKYGAFAVYAVMHEYEIESKSFLNYVEKEIHDAISDMVGNQRKLKY